MNKYFACYFLVLMSLSVFAQEPTLQKSPDVYQDTTANSSPHFYFHEDLTITMADGNTKKVSELRAGEPIKCVRKGIVTTTCIEKIEASRNSSAWLTTLYLRPVDEWTASQRTWPLVPALLLETTPTLHVKTQEGPKAISQLRKGDILYRHEPGNQRVVAWKVGIVRHRTRQVSTLYSLRTEEGSVLLENMIALED